MSLYTNLDEVDIYQMELHDLFTISDKGQTYSILRVHGGWIYSLDFKGYQTCNTVFVKG